MTKTKRSISNEFRPEDDFRKTKRNLNGCLNLDSVKENVRIKENRIMQKTSEENIVRESMQKARKVNMKDLIDEIDADLEEVSKKKLKDTPNFKHEALFNDESSISKSFSMRGSHKKDLGLILEESSEDLL